jgi:hypothetical protein
MEKLSTIIYTSALETYDLVEKNKKPIVKLITMFLPKETRDFILKKEFDYNTYYSKSELEENQTNQSTQQNEQNIKNKIKKKRKGKNSRKQSIGLSNSTNKPKVRYILDNIPENLLNFIIFFSYLSLHSIYFWSVLIIILFVTNINYLLIGLFIVITNASGMILFSGCPINVIERKYRNKLTNNQFFLCNIIKKIYDDHHYYDYEENIERFVFAIFALFIKINLIILYKVFIRGLFNP